VSLFLAIVWRTLVALCIAFLLLTLFAAAALFAQMAWTWFKRVFRSRGKEAGVSEERDDEMAVAEAAKADDFAVWEAECARLQRLADKLGSRS
jgi:hypothetical protein